MTPPVPVEVFAAEARKSGGKVMPVSRFVDGAGAATDDGLVPIIMSTSGEDRSGDTVADDGWDLADYLRNPVLLWCHDMDDPAIGTMVNLATGPLRGSMKFATREQNPFGDMIGGLVKAGIIRGGSVGFLPLDWSFMDGGGVQFRKQKLLEFSVCNVPMNAECLASAKSMGIDVGLFLPYAEKTLDGDPKAPAWMDGKQAGVIYRSLGARVHQVPAAQPTGPSNAELLAEVKRLGSIVESFGRTLEAAKSAPIAAPPRPVLTPEKAAALTAEILSKKLAALTGRAPQD